MRADINQNFGREIAMGIVYDNMEIFVGFLCYSFDIQYIVRCRVERKMFLC